MAYSTIDKSSSFMNPKIYTGTGASVSFTGVGFQPDLVWCKVRTAGSGVDHNLFDAVRGVQKRIESNSTAVEATRTDALSAFDSDGFSFNGSNSAVNSTGDTYVAWNWLAGNSAGSANTDGSISSTVSANSTSKMSIVKYTGTGVNATIGHGLGVAPAFILIKQLNETRDWAVYQKTISPESGLLLNNTTVKWTDTGYFNDTAATSSVFSIGVYSETNKSGGDFIAYCFSELSGYSKFGIYTGNGDSASDGQFIYTGFKPTFIMVKRTNGTKDWHIFDTTRSTSNVTKPDLKPNTDAVEDDSNDWLDILSNGFKWRIMSGDADYGDVNGDGDTYIYAAFGQPIVSNSGTPATAR